MPTSNKQITTHGGRHTKISSILLLTTVLSFAHSGLAMGVKNVALIPNEGVAEKIEIPLNLALRANSLKLMVEDLGGPDAIADKQEIPLWFSASTLRVVIASLESVVRLEEEGREANFPNLKEIVLNAFSAAGMPFSPDEIFKFVLAINHLDICEELIATTSMLFVDALIGVPKTVEEWANAAKQLELLKASIPEEIFVHFKDFINWFKDPLSSVAVGSNPSEIVMVDNKLYFYDRFSERISVIDTKTNKQIAFIPMGYKIKQLIACGTKLYVTNYDDGTISVIDANTDKVIGSIPVSSRPDIKLIASGTKLYAASNKISVIDTNTDTVVGLIQTVPDGFIVSGIKLYVINYHDGNISIFDTYTYKRIGAIEIDRLPKKLIASGTKLYGVNSDDGVLAVIDTKDDMVTGSIRLGSRVDKFIVCGTKLYVADGDANSISVVDTNSDTVIQSIKLEKEVDAFAICGSALCVANGEKISMIDINTDTEIRSINVATNISTLLVCGTKLYLLHPWKAYIIVVNIGPSLRAQDAYASINARINKQRDTRLIKAVLEQNIDEVRKLLAAGANPLEQKEDGNSAVNFALWGKCPEIKSLVCEHFWDINRRINSQGDTVLIKAVFEQNIDEVKKLLAAGANPLVAKYDGSTAVDFAKWGASAEIKELILNNFRVLDFNKPKDKPRYSSFFASQYAKAQAFF